MSEEYLKEIAQHLSRIADSLAKPASTEVKLGFGEAPKTATQYVFCNRKHGGFWYVLNEQSQPQVIDSESITGYIRKLEFKQVERRGEETYKLHTTIEADKLYVLESGSKAHFTKGFLSAISMMSQEQLKRPVTLVPKPADDPNNKELLFCNVFCGDSQVFSPYDKDTDFSQISKVAIGFVKKANPEQSETSENKVPDFQEENPPQDLTVPINRAAVNRVKELYAIAEQQGFSTDGLFALMSQLKYSIDALTDEQFKDLTENQFMQCDSSEWNKYAASLKQNTA